MRVDRATRLRSRRRGGENRARGRADVPSMADREPNQAPGPDATKSEPPRLVSSYSGDPEMQELLAYFIEDLSRRVDLLKSALDSLDAKRLRAIAHQLAGSAGGYGYAPIGDAARALEREIDDDRHEDIFDGIEDEMTISAVREKAEDLITTCRRAIDGGRSE